MDTMTDFEPIGDSSTHRWTFENRCKKRGYYSYDDAAAVALGQRRRHDARVAPYHCTYCKMFHVGESRRGKRAYDHAA